jgi:transposase
VAAAERFTAPDGRSLPRWVRTTQELVQHVGKTTWTISRYKYQHGAPLDRVRGKGYDLQALLQWMRERGYACGINKSTGRPTNTAVDVGLVAGSASVSAVADVGGDRLPGNEDRRRLLKAQAKEREAKAELVALRLAVERGEFLPLDEVKARDIARIHVVKRGLLAHARSLPPLLQGLGLKEMEVVITRAVRELLLRFSKM